MRLAGRCEIWSKGCVELGCGVWCMGVSLVPRPSHTCKEGLVF